MNCITWLDFTRGGADLCDLRYAKLAPTCYSRHAQFS